MAPSGLRRVEGMPMTEQQPTTFTEFVEVLDQLPVILLNARRARRASQRAMASEAGLSFSTVSRIEAGEEHSSVSLRAVLLWLDAEAPDGERP